MGRISVIGGTGDLGFWLALRLAKAGLDIVIGSRSREKAMEAVNRGLKLVGEGASLEGAVNREAVIDSEVVFFSIPYQAIGEIASDVSPSMNTRSIAVSCIVPFDKNNGELSAAEMLSSHLDGVPVVSTLHTVGAERLARLNEPLNSDTLVFGDIMDAKKKIAAILYLIDGLRPVDGGPLKNSRIGEHIVRILLSVNRRYGVKDAGIQISGLTDRMVREKWGL
jgi:NADPH-dependent F420 reductase